MSTPRADPKSRPRAGPQPGPSVRFEKPQARQGLVALAILALVLGALLVGAALAADFGVNWDEAGDADYGRDALRAYRAPAFDWDSYGKRKYYGPAHFMFQVGLADALAPLVNDWGEAEVRHFANYLTFMVAVLGFYLLARPFTAPAVAGVATLLFATQPLYVGHAFINGKDTPFMAFFLLAIAAGTRSAMRLPVRGESPEVQGLHYRSAIAADWRLSPRWTRVVLILCLSLGIVAGLDRWLTRAMVYNPARAVVRAAYLDRAPLWVNQLFDRSAETAAVVPIDNYLLAGDRLLDGWLEGAALSLAWTAAVLAVWRFTRLRRLIWEEVRHPSLRPWVKWEYLGWFALAGVAAGLAMANRSVGVFAILLIGVFYLGIHRGRALLPWLTLTVLAGAIAYAAWPFLWGRPLAGFQESVEFLAGNPNRDYVLFLGEVTKGRLLPWFFLPSLMAFQFTEPIGILATLGLASFFHPRRPPYGVVLAIVLALWLLVPTVPLILQHAWFYDNFRQFLFITPALFILAALGMDRIWQVLGQPGRIAARWVLAALIIVPGLVAVIRLHPYEYTYFNALVAGTRGAFRNFELDYWATAYSAAIKQLNTTLPAGATVAFLGTKSPAEPYARPDLTLRTYAFDADPSTVKADVIVATTRANADIDLQRFTCRVAEIEIDGAVLASIREPMPCDPAR